MKTALPIFAAHAIAIAITLASSCFAANAANFPTQSERIATDNGVSVKTAGQYEIWTKTGNSDWIQSGFDSRIHGVAFGNGTFVIVGNEGALFTSRDAISWTARNAGTDERLRSVAFGNGVFVVVGYNGVILTSPNGKYWTKRNSGTTERLAEVQYRTNLFTTSASSRLTRVSTNGIRWIASPTPSVAKLTIAR